MKRMKKKVPHVMERFILMPPEGSAGKGDFGFKGVKPASPSLKAISLYYILHAGKGEVVEEWRGAGKCSHAVCVDARVPAPPGWGKTFAGLLLPEEGGLEKGDKVYVVGHTDCGYMKVALSANAWLSLFAGKDFRALQAFAKAERREGPLYQPLASLAEELSPEDFGAFAEDLLLRGMVAGSLSSLRPHFPLLAPNLLEDYDKALLLFTLEAVERHTLLLRERDIEAEPALYITESGRFALIKSGLEVREGLEGPVLGSIPLEELLAHPLWKFNALLGMYMEEA